MHASLLQLVSARARAGALVGRLLWFVGGSWDLAAGGMDCRGFVMF